MAFFSFNASKRTTFLLALQKKKNLENNDVIQAISSKTANDKVSIEG